jgi:hypothetical protein
VPWTDRWVKGASCLVADGHELVVPELILTPQLDVLQDQQVDERFPGPHL